MKTFCKSESWLSSHWQVDDSWCCQHNLSVMLSQDFECHNNWMGGSEKLFKCSGLQTGPSHSHITIMLANSRTELISRLLSFTKLSAYDSVSYSFSLSVFVSYHEEITQICTDCHSVPLNKISWVKGGSSMEHFIYCLQTHVYCPPRKWSDYNK